MAKGATRSQAAIARAFASAYRNTVGQIPAASSAWTWVNEKGTGGPRVIQAPSLEEGDEEDDLQRVGGVVRSHHRDVVEPQHRGEGQRDERGDAKHGHDRHHHAERQRQRQLLGRHPLLELLDDRRDHAPLSASLTFPILPGS